MNSQDAYLDFLARKRIVDPSTGMEHVGDLPDFLKEHQRDLVRWALRRGRAAIFAGTGLGKTACELVWSNRVADHTHMPVIIFAPLAVSSQHIREAQKFGLRAKLAKSQSDITDNSVYVTNLQKMDHFDLSKFGGVAIDESSCLKSCDSFYRNRLIEECSDIPFRLAATATPAPNDYVELGNHAEFLGVMRYTDMLATFFTHDGGETQKWILKSHAENDFWRWMSSWSVMLRKPSDLGYDDAGYDLPPLRQVQHTAAVAYAPSIESGLLFPMQATTLQERVGARRASVKDRVALAASITPTDRQFVWWCNLNAESEALVKAIPGAVETKGSDSDEVKERKILDFIEGRTRVLVTKSNVCGFGLNLQCCCDTGFVGLNDSFEQIYQAVRRFWRFGQTKPVTAHFIAAESEGAVVANLRRKEIDAERMAAGMVIHTASISSELIRGMTRDRPDYNPDQPMKIPSWLEEAA